MSFEEILGNLLDAKLAPLTEEVRALKERNSQLEKLLTSQGGERQSDLLTLEQVAKRLHVSKQTVLRYVARGRLHPPTGTGQARRWRVRDLTEFGEAS